MQRTGFKYDLPDIRGLDRHSRVIGSHGPFGSIRLRHIKHAACGPSHGSLVREREGADVLIGFFAAISAAVAVAAGAFGAHAASGQQEAEWLRTGGLYQLLHAVAALAMMGIARGPAILLLVGSAVFALTLYAMAFGAPRWLGAVTPIGGTLLIGGWLSAVRIYSF